MNVSLRISEDGSHTLYREDIDETYHSCHGAIQEAVHVFIQSGLVHFSEKSDQAEIEILEVGFGTGLNAILSHIAGSRLKRTIHYTGYELFPLDKELLDKLNYDSVCPNIAGFSEKLRKIHSCEWQKSVEIDSDFHLTKIKACISQEHCKEKYDLLYFDAFGPRAEPTLWEKEILSLMYDALKPTGVFVTYCAKGQVRRDLISLGFTVERLPGPPGKREMLRATK
jgi:tRNA U34 5-methylaminomethyl-2-thiouridine-forming methyltransferase MnmC